MTDYAPWRLSAVTLLVSCLAVRALAFDLPGGLEFGQSFPDVEAIARDNQWSLRQSEVVSYGWVVENMGITLYFCDEFLTSKDQSTDGTLSSFVETVVSYRFRYGEPDTDVFTLSPRSQYQRHSVQSVFETNNGLRISVQLNAHGDRQTLFTRISDHSVCETK
ncbi:MAG: hypothetical protein NXH97_22980 [Rhodobacteraceae bacterium]|nr:hypothetical protein [Paracoccaceae bacterium]